MGIYEDATEGAVSTAVFGLIENCEPGQWYDAAWDDLRSSKQAAISGCNKAGLVLVEADGLSIRYKLSPAGEAIQHSRDAIMEAFCEGSGNQPKVSRWLKPSNSSANVGTDHNKQPGAEISRAAPGEYQKILEAKLLEWHKYESHDGLPLNFGPIEFSNLVFTIDPTGEKKKARVTEFLKKVFGPGGYVAYKTVCRNEQRLVARLKAVADGSYRRALALRDDDVRV